MIRSSLLTLLFYSATLSAVFADDLGAMRIRAAEGDASSQYLLAVRYDAGDGVHQDYSEARTWYLKAAEQGIAAARNNLGVLYQLGQGVPQDYTEALRWYRLAADQGFAQAQYNIGLMYAEGLGVTQDPAEARRWLQLAAGQGNGAARDRLKKLPADHVSAVPDARAVPTPGVEGVMTGVQTPAGSPPPSREEQQVAGQENVAALYKLGMMSRSRAAGAGTAGEALRLIRQAAEKGYPPAQNELGAMYFNGDGVTTNYDEALRWFLLSAEQGYARAQNNLGIMYQQGLGGVIMNHEKAAVWYRLAADQQLPAAQRNLGRMYFNGWGVMKDDREATRLLTLAAQQGDEPAATILKNAVIGTPFRRQ